ncbi:MAG: hypothetical protein DBX37_00465 [Massilioclostridium sp.]|nr:MAG: hypothetical protein DBX37_00465 [Massilioclostridium sp.]
MNLGKLLTVYGIEVSILTESPDTYAELADGIDNIAEALNEVVQQYFFLKDKGFATNHVTGMAPAYTLTGRRVVGDAAQDFIFSKKFGLDTERQTKLKIVCTDEKSTQKTLTCPCTICNMQEYSGASTDDSAISFELRFDGKPEIA